MYLVGTGPGDPGLLTLRAAQLMGSADVVLYDRRVGLCGVLALTAPWPSAEGWRGCRLVSPEILQLIHGGAMMVYVGKQKGFHTRTQDEIHALLCRFAHAGATVLRLKGGDPYIFGRGGEEAQYLREHGIVVHCVPGALPCLSLQKKPQNLPAAKYALLGAAARRPCTATPPCAQ